MKRILITNIFREEVKKLRELKWIKKEKVEVNLNSESMIFELLGTSGDIAWAVIYVDGADVLSSAKAWIRIKADGKVVLEDTLDRVFLETAIPVGPGFVERETWNQITFTYSGKIGPIISFNKDIRVDFINKSTLYKAYYTFRGLIKLYDTVIV